MKNGEFPLSVQGAHSVLLSVSQIEVKILLDCDGNQTRNFYQFYDII